MRGGGTAGPSGEVENERAGEPGEYHHSRNLTKNMAVGRRSLKESKRTWGDVKTKRRIQARGLRGGLGSFILDPAAVRYVFC